MRRFTSKSPTGAFLPPFGRGGRGGRVNLFNHLSLARKSNDEPGGPAVPEGGRVAQRQEASSSAPDFTSAATSPCRATPPGPPFLRGGDAILPLAVLALFLLASPATAADPPEIAVQAGASEIFVGESVDYIVEIRNVKNPPAPDIEALREDFDVVARGNQSRNQSTVMSFNGRVTERNVFSHVFRFQLTPRRAGNLTIPGPSATIDGKTITGEPLELNVVAPEEQDIVIPEIIVNRAKVYPTQPFEVTLKVFVRPLPDAPERDPLSALRRQPPQINANWVDTPAGLAADDKNRWLEKLLAADGAGFKLNDINTQSASLFEGPRAAVFNLLQGRETRPGLDGRPVNYFLYELKRSFVPEKTGTYVFGPAIVKGVFVVGSDRKGYKGKNLVAVASAVPVEVREIPAPRPATFCGGIGEYRVTASASPDALRVGDPLTLTLDVERGAGSGSLELISAPDLAANAEVAADFAILDKNPTGHSEGNIKRFTYALRPKRAGVTIPALTMTVFDPDTEKFAQVATRPIALTVTEGSQVGAGDLVGALTTSGTPEIKSRDQGIFQNVTDISQLRDQNVNVIALAETAAGLWCGVGLLMGLVTSQRRKSGDVVWLRKQRARRNADHKLVEARAALAEGQSTEALRAIRAAVVGLIADMRNIVAEGLTSAEADKVLAQTTVPADERAGVSRLLETIESAEYGSAAASETPAMLAYAEALVSSLARHLK